MNPMRRSAALLLSAALLFGVACGQQGHEKTVSSNVVGTVPGLGFADVASTTSTAPATTTTGPRVTSSTTGSSATTATTRSAITTTTTRPVSTTTTTRPVSTTTTTQPSLSNDDYYTNVDGNSVHSPAQTSNGQAPAGATAQCRDGSYSFSQHRSGTCSGHGGVDRWL
jgi:hypothetical protein